MGPRQGNARERAGRRHPRVAGLLLARARQPRRRRRGRGRSRVWARRGRARDREENRAADASFSKTAGAARGERDLATRLAARGGAVVRASAGLENEGDAGGTSPGVRAEAAALSGRCYGCGVVNGSWLT